MSFGTVLLYLLAFQVTQLYSLAEINNAQYCFTPEDNKYFIEYYPNYLNNSTEYFARANSIKDCIVDKNTLGWIYLTLQDNTVYVNSGKLIAVGNNQSASIWVKCQDWQIR